MEGQVERLFAKRFALSKQTNYELPGSESMFKTPPWNFEPLQNLKAELNRVKNLLNNYKLDKWHAHTKFRNSAKDVIKRVRMEIQPEFVTQAWCKFYEIVTSYPLVPVDLIQQNGNRFKSVHLCEAPGAFVASLNHWLKSNLPDVTWNWAATSLNPYYEGNALSIMIDDDRFIQHTLDHWHFGVDCTGNLMTLENLDALINFCKPSEDILLVTADGSINCCDMPGEQENMVAHLCFCETVTALSLLTNGGSFLLKIFTTFEHHFVCLLYLLCCCFETVDIVKPATSKEGNSETYVVCTNFKGRAFISDQLNVLRKHYEKKPVQAMFPIDKLPSFFLDKITECSKFFLLHQCSVIMNNIVTFKDARNSYSVQERRQLQQIVADRYMSQYHLKKLTAGDIVGKELLEKTGSINNCRRLVAESYNQRLEKQGQSLLEQLSECLKNMAYLQYSTSIDVAAVYKVKKLPKDLTVVIGKKFKRVYSSRFCLAECSALKTCIDSILEQFKVTLELPVTQQENNTLYFEPPVHCDSHKTLEIICERLENLQIGESLTLVNYPLLTLFNVGVLHLIGHSFDSISFELTNIVLQNYNCRVDVQKRLLDLRLISRDTREKEKVILGIYPALFLYESGLYQAIVDYNHRTIIQAGCLLYEKVSTQCDSVTAEAVTQ